MKKEQYMGLDVYFRPETADVAIIRHSFLNDIFFPAIPDFRPNSTPVIIDIGAHIGTFSLLAAIKLKGCLVYAFEPNDDSYRVLALNIEQNNLQNILPQKVAITKQPGQVDLYLDSENWGHSTTFKFGSAKQTVNSIRLGDFLDNNLVRNCDLIKFNCEGAEFEIINSLDERQLNRIGMMLVLYHEDLAKSGRVSVLLKHLRSHGFSCRIVNKRNSRGWLIAKNRHFYKNRFPRTASDLIITLKEFRTLLF